MGSKPKEPEARARLVSTRHWGSEALGFQPSAKELAMRQAGPPYDHVTHVTTVEDLAHFMKADTNREGVIVVPVKVIQEFARRYAAACDLIREGPLDAIARGALAKLAA